MENEINIGKATLVSLNLMSKLNRTRLLSVAELIDLRAYLLICVDWLDKEINDDLG